jgi:sulfoxide reductase heme-binding subunit YedZ
MTLRTTKLYKSLLFVACLIPLALLVWRGYQQHLGANPIETITHETGLWTLRLLLITLLVTPLRRLTGWNAVQRVRRMFGMFAFFYGTLHFMTYVWLDQFFVWGDIVHDVMKRPFITVGFSAYLLLLPLAATSTNAMMKRLGRRWQTLHRLVYAIPTLGVLHYLWLVKADINPPLTYGALLLLLLGVRVWWMHRKRNAITSAAVVALLGDNKFVNLIWPPVRY